MRTDDVVGLIPCAGLATRIAPLPCSKELFPIGFHRKADGSVRPKLVSHYLLEKMHEGGVRRAFLILRSGKWDIPQYYGNGKAVGMDLGYLMMGKSYGPPYTLDQAYLFVKGARVAFGFPDILFRPNDAYKRALERLSSTRADIVLGLYPAHKRWTWHAVATNSTGRVQKVFMNRSQTKSKLGWVFAVWTSRFTEFMHEYLALPRTAAEQPGTGLPTELTVGEVIQAAISKGLRTQGVMFPRRTYVDIGTPEELQRITARSANSF